MARNHNMGGGHFLFSEEPSILCVHCIQIAVNKEEKKGDIGAACEEEVEEGG